MTDRFRVGANLATLANGLLGAGAVGYTLAGNKLWAMLLIAMGIGFDGLDGLLSRRSRLPPSDFGRVADSVADAVTFGIAPAVLLAVHTSDPSTWRPYADALVAVAALYASCAIARLTYFTVRAHGLGYFLGVPTPQSALAVVALLLFHDTPGYAGVQPLGTLIGGAIVSVMMIVPVPYPKVRRPAWMRWPTAATAVLAAIALVPLQFRPAAGTPVGLVAEIGAYGLLIGVAVYYLVGPFTVRRKSPSPR